MGALAIHDRSAFYARLAEAEARALELPIAEAERQHILRDLAWMQRSTRGGRLPDDDELMRTTLGPRSLELSGCPAADIERLQQLDYAFRRFRALPPVFVSHLPNVAERRGIVHVRYGKGAFDKRSLEPGERLVIGSDARADLVIADLAWAGRHLEIVWESPVGHVRTLTDRPVVIDGRRVLRGELTHQSTLTVGRSTLRFFVEAFSDIGSSHDTPALDAIRARVDGAWSSHALYLVADAARSPRTLLLLEESIDEHAPLYEGERARGLDGVAPYLVRLSPRSGLLHRWLREGWGEAWGVFLVSRAPTKLVRRALRRVLMVQADTRPHPLYFRFYDPRVLRRFAPLATPRQLSELFTDIESFVYEAENGAVAELRREATP